MTVAGVGFPTPSGAARARVGFAEEPPGKFSRGWQLARVGFARPQHPEKFFRKCNSRAWGLLEGVSFDTPRTGAARGVANAQLNPFFAPGPPGAL